MTIAPQLPFLSSLEYERVLQGYFLVRGTRQRNRILVLNPPERILEVARRAGIAFRSGKRVSFDFPRWREWDWTDLSTEHVWLMLAGVFLALPPRFFSRSLDPRIAFLLSVSGLPHRIRKRSRGTLVEIPPEVHRQLLAALDF